MLVIIAVEACTEAPLRVMGAFLVPVSFSVEPTGTSKSAPTSALPRVSTEPTEDLISTVAPAGIEMVLVRVTSCASVITAGASAVAAAICCARESSAVSADAGTTTMASSMDKIMQTERIRVRCFFNGHTSYKISNICCEMKAGKFAGATVKPS